jgi:hypothetical protein
VDTETDLEALSSRELHDLAVHRALHHADVAFFWELLRAIPAAETLEVDEREAGEDLTKVSALLSDALTSGDGDLAEALRPLYLDYLRKHPKLAIRAASARLIAGIAWRGEAKHATVRATGKQRARHTLYGRAALGR